MVNYINNRLTVPSYVDINVDVVGDSYGGTAYYTVVVEQDPGVTGPFKIWSAIVESNEIASSSYGVYAGQELMWEPRAMPLGNYGTEISITGPYPQTIYSAGSYTLDPTQHTFENLDVVTYVQSNVGSHEVLNASFLDLPDTAVGIGEQTEGVTLEISITASPNPSSGLLTIIPSLPPDQTAKVTIFDLAGRTARELPCNETSQVLMEEPGMYFARLETSSGQVATTRFTVVR